MTLRIILLLDVQRHLYGVRGLFGKYLKCPFYLGKGEDSAGHRPCTPSEDRVIEDSQC